MLAPNPSTVPIRVSVAMSGSGTPAWMRWRACATFGTCSGQVSSGTWSTSVPKVSVFCACQASMAGTRCFVRGDT
jgi:hypothetical protein